MDRVDRRLRLAVYHDGPGVGGGSHGVGGSAISVATLLENLDPAVDVIVLGVNPLVPNWIAAHRPGAKAKVISPVRNKWDVRGMFNHFRAVRDLRPDILQVHLPTLWSGRYAILAGILLPGVKVIVVDHTPVPPWNRQVVWAKRFLMRLTSANVAVSKALARHVEGIARLRPGSVRVIYNGVTDPGPPAPPRRNDPPVIGTIVRLSEQKGADIFLRALTHIPNAVGVVVGDGENRAQLEELSIELGLSQRVTWMGWQNDTRDLLNGFDVFVLASRYEGLGRVLVEAALAGCPCVATRVTGTSEAIVDGETGLLVPPEDPDALSRAIITLLEDEERAEEMGKRGRTFALGRFNPTVSARAYESLYKDVLGRDLHRDGLTTTG